MYPQTHQSLNGNVSGDNGERRLRAIGRLDARVRLDLSRLILALEYQTYRLWPPAHTRDVKPTCDDPFTIEADAMTQGCWPEPEMDENVNEDELGDLKLTSEQEDAIVAFLKTLSDGYVAD